MVELFRMTGKTDAEAQTLACQLMGLDTAPAPKGCNN
jgi:hypothetical protein